MKKMKLLKNAKGEYNYQFNWVDENGMTVGFNDVWAANKREAIKNAKKMEKPAKDYTWGRMTGMFVDVKSMYKATAAQAAEMTRIGWLLTV
jgi:hypothetical protein